ncbi:MAG: dual specificity protein phosphatase [Methanomicrobiaceae archaeon]|nr:dual specificity protein phosphatase [Methanomicrobiaceae archaeon]
MIEIYPDLYLGNEYNYEAIQDDPAWWVVHAAREPHHREALGYRGHGPPEGHPEYFVARRGSELMLNLLDACDPEDVPEEAVDAALAFIDEGLAGGHRVLLHCSYGCSRSPVIALLYLAKYTDTFPKGHFPRAECLPGLPAV